MMVMGIAVATMLAVAVVVFAVEIYMYKKHHAKRDKGGAREATAAGREAPLTS